ncbi:hypothetical protein ISP15_14135 [Dyella jejuensis]|uniref:FecR family protein n=1 Tax=Dyella jejuensis TaxID=1432009 RepID=A0ABW8JNN9_9GAMM
MRAFEFAVPFSRGWRLLFAALLLGAGAAHAQTDAGDPPARVARVAYAAGDLGLMPAGSTAWSAADINRPLTNGDKLSSGPDAKAELDLGGAALRIAGGSDLGVLNLNEQIGQFELTQGTLNLSVRNLDPGASYEIDTPTLALVLNQPGIVRVDVDGDGNATSVTVFDGVATVYGENHAQREVYSGRHYQFNDSALNNVVVDDSEGGDAFDVWCSGRDAQEANSAGAQYVSDDVVGSDDLDNWGSWEEDEDYGAVWYPANVAVGWAPYRFGHWVWIAPWGWTWIDDLPWGFAPYHYGRWAFMHNRWGWIPGPRRMRPVYAPALVAFVGSGRSGPVGWFPLGPRDVYNPWYRASRNYYTGVNLSNLDGGRYGDRGALATAIHHQYALYQGGRPIPASAYTYRHAAHALTAVSAQAFASARNVQSSQVHLNAQQMAAASVLAPAALQRPAAASFGRPRAVSARPLPSAAFNRTVVAVGRPAAALAATASARAGRPASQVRILDAHVNAAPRVITGEGFARPATRGVPAASRPAAPSLPQVPHFEQAQQIRPIEQAPRAQPQPSVQEEQQRFGAAQHSHEYVPEQARPYAPMREPNPSYEPQPRQYGMPQYAHPEQARPQEFHPSQNAPHPRESAPASPRNDSQH